jgi:hypothetical protein
MTQGGRRTLPMSRLDRYHDRFSAVITSIARRTWYVTVLLNSAAAGMVLIDAPEIPSKGGA